MTETWESALNRWQGWLRSAGKPNTTVGLRIYHLSRFARECPDPYGVDVDALTAWLGTFTWGSETRRSYRSSLRQFYHWAHVTGRMTSDPAALLPPVKVSRGVPRPAPEKVFRAAVLRADARVSLMVRLAGSAGLRRGEIARAHTDWLDEDEDGWVLHIIGKGGHERRVPLLEDLAREISRLPSGYLFAGKIDGHLSPAYVGKLLSRVLDEHWTGHTLRHRFAGKAYVAERDIRAVQELLGHASVATTQIYTPIPAGALRAAVTAAA